ncbi:Deleted in malignant brain tumors 1 protein, partial [Geodia barretti]
IPDHITPSPVTDLRLVGGVNATEGRVEIFFNNTWGTICDDSWDFRDAEVVCRYLGFESAIEALSNGYFGAGDPDQPIWLDDVDCFGSENIITSCLTSRFGVHNCVHLEDAGVRCYLSHPLVRLVNGNTEGEGRVEVFHRGSWGTVCDDHWSEIDANIVCQELGFAHAISASGFATFGEGSGTIWLDDVQCDGTETTIFACPNSGWGNHNCLHSEDASAICTAIPVNPNPVQLIDGPSINEGRLQIYYNNEWGTVCDDRWGLDEASVVCKSLGFPGADRDKYLLHDYGLGSGHIWLDDVVCTGEEFFIQDCNHGDIGENNCAHYEDVGLRCLPNTLNIRLVNGDNTSSGRVEVNYNDEEWGTICDDSWDIRDADVVCRMLNFKSAQSAPREASFGDGLGVIWFDDFLCAGDESSLLDCSHAGVKVHNCRHSEDASAVCSMMAVCPDFSQAHGRFRVSNQHFGRYTQDTRVVVACDDGYQPTEGAANVVCLAAGTWSPHMPACSASCPLLTPPDHSSLSTMETTPGLTVTLICNRGYKYNAASSGDRSVVCGFDGQWNSTLGSCEIVLCPSYSSNVTANVRVTVLRGSGTTVGTTLSFSCPDSSHIMGNAVISCLDSGAWNGTVPVCTGAAPTNCPRLALSDHVLVTSQDTSINTVVSFSCDQGYTLNGDRVIACLSTGVWNGTVPSCTAPTNCQRLALSDHVLVTSQDTSINTVVSFSCDQGYTLNGDRALACLSTGVWNGTAPSCTAPTNCTRLTVSDHVLVSSQDTSINTVVSFSCDQGYTLNGDRVIACLSTGVWNESAPSCTKPTCPKLTLSSHVTSSSGNNSVHAVVMFSCEDGYTLDGDKQITCREDGTWSNSPPSCSSPPSFQSQKDDNASNVGAIVGGVIGGILVILLIVVATAIIFWKMSSRYSKTGYSNIRMRRADDRIELFADEDGDADEPLYSAEPTEDDAQLDL